MYTQVLGSALKRHMDENERSTLLHQLMLLKNASLELVNTVIGIISNSNDNDLILVSGALARNSDHLVQKVVIKELVERLNLMLSSSDVGAVTTLIYALGNSRSKLIVNPLLPTLEHNDIDIQISAIRSLKFHLDQPDVEQAIIALLHLSREDIILEEVLNALLYTCQNKILTSPSKGLIIAIMNRAVQLKNPHLYELVAKYLHEMKIDDVDIYMGILKHQDNYGDLQYDYVSGTDGNYSRIKRGTDWDSSSSSYNSISSYSTRRSDVTNYPNHKAYIYSQSFDVSSLGMTVGVGAFSGMAIGSRSVSYKQFAKAAADVNLFGSSYSVTSLEISTYTYGNYLYQKKFLKRGSSTRKNEDSKVSVQCKKNTINFNAYSGEIFEREISFYVYVTTVYFDISGTASFDVSVGGCTCLTNSPPTAKANSDLKLSFSLSVSGSTSVSLAVRMHRCVSIYILNNSFNETLENVTI